MPSPPKPAPMIITSASNGCGISRGCGNLLLLSMPSADARRSSALLPHCGYTAKQRPTFDHKLRQVTTGKAPSISAMRIARHAAMFFALVGLYFWFIAQPSRDELYAAGVCALIVVAFMLRVESVVELRARAPLAGFVAIAIRVPLAMFRESFDILVPALWRAVVRRERVAGRWIALRYEPDDGRDGFGRRALVIFGSGITPNAFPIAIDGEQGRLYLHQLVARREAAADHPRFPL